MRRLERELSNESRPFQVPAPGRRRSNRKTNPMPAFSSVFSRPSLSLPPKQKNPTAPSRPVSARARSAAPLRSELKKPAGGRARPRSGGIVSIPSLSRRIREAQAPSPKKTKTAANPPTPWGRKAALLPSAALVTPKVPTARRAPPSTPHPKRRSINYDPVASKKPHGAPPPRAAATEASASPPAAAPPQGASARASDDAPSPAAAPPPPPPPLSPLQPPPLPSASTGPGLGGRGATAGGGGEAERDHLSWFDPADAAKVALARRALQGAPPPPPPGCAPLARAVEARATARSASRSSAAALASASGGLASKNAILLLRRHRKSSTRAEASTASAASTAVAM